MESKAGDEEGSVPPLSHEYSTKSALAYLPLKDSEIRLLRICPELVSDKIQLILEHFSCSANYEPTQAYRAVSYCWGDVNDTVIIIVNGQELSVTRSLEAGLREFPKQSGSRDYFWIDAICINQKDEAERGHQIGKMKDIYYNAFETYIWLGKDDGLSRAAFSIMDTLATRTPTETFLELTSQLSNSRVIPLEAFPGWASFIATFGLPYWGRTWIIQEMAMSLDVLFLWGSHTVSLKTMSATIVALYNNLPSYLDIRGICGGLLDLLKIRRLFDLDPGNELIAERTYYQRRRTAPGLDLILAMCLSSPFEATEIRDKVFGVLGLAYDGLVMMPKPNYQEPLDSILRQVTINKLKDKTASHVLDTICLDMVVYPKDDNHPSWVIDWARIWDYGRRDPSIYNQMQDCVVDYGYGYKACGPSHPLIAISPDGLVLTCRGFPVTTIGCICQYDWDARLPRELSDTNYPSQIDSLVSQNIYGSEENLRQAIWFTLVSLPTRRMPHEGASRAQVTYQLQRILSDTNRKKYWQVQFANAFEEVEDFEISGRRIKHWLRDYLDDINASPATVVEDDGKLDQRIKKILLDCIEVGKSRQTMMQATNGYVGMAHPRSMVGDAIVLLEGASRPFVLRPCEGGYRLVGEAYVHGIMHGEFWNAQDKADMQDFHLH